MLTVHACLVDAIQRSNVLVRLIDDLRRVDLLASQDVDEVLRSQRNPTHWIVLIGCETRWLQEW